MAKEKTYHLQFDGYWREINKKFTPEFSGIYLIHTCRFVPESKTVTLTGLIYIGQAKNLRKRIADHSEEEFIQKIKSGETICYACAPVGEADLNIVENGLVFAEKPFFNDKLKDHYSYDDAQFWIEGNSGKLKHTFFKITTSKDG